MTARIRYIVLMATGEYPKLQKAVRWAAKQHKNQYRDGEHPLPYITHPIDVLVNLRYVGGVTDEDLMCVAMLHDVVEETGTPLEEIEDRFGLRVRELVQELTRREPTPEETAEKSEEQVWKLRAAMLLKEIARMSPEAKTVKLADRLSNVIEAQRTKKGHKLDRYIAQSRSILGIIPKETNEGLWTAIETRIA